MSCLSYLNPVEVLDKLLRDQDEHIEAVYQTKYRQVWESASVSVEVIISTDLWRNFSSHFYLDNKK